MWDSGCKELQEEARSTFIQYVLDPVSSYEEDEEVPPPPPMQVSKELTESEKELVSEFAAQHNLPQFSFKEREEVRHENQVETNLLQVIHYITC